MKTTPIVFVTAANPVGGGFFEPRAPRPQCHQVTNITVDRRQMAGTALIAPNIERVAVIFNPATATGSRAYSFRRLSPRLSIAVTTLAMPVHNPSDIESALAAFGRVPNGGLIVIPDNFTPFIVIRLLRKPPAKGSGDLCITAFRNGRRPDVLRD